MLYQKLMTALVFTFFTSASLMAAGCNDMPSCERPLVLLKQAMQEELVLTEGQTEHILGLNRKYWFSRKRILNTPDKIGQNTAVLACWDKWMEDLTLVLTEAQMQKFMAWQSRVNLLGETPY